MMGGDNKATNENRESVTATATPYSTAKPLLDYGLNDALANYGNVQRSANWDDLLRRGVQGVEALAEPNRAGNPLGPAFHNFANTFGTDGMNSTMRSSMGQMGDVTAGFGELAGPRTSMSESNLSDVARGGMLNRNDPNFERLLQRARETAATEATMAAGSMGRTGSDYHQGLVAETVGDLEANARLQQYNTERERQVQANQLIDAQRMGIEGNRLAALGGQAGSLGQQFGMGQQGMANTANAGSIWEQLYGAAMRPSMDLIQLGQTPNAALADLLAAAQAGQPYATRIAQTNGLQTQAQPANTAGKIAGGLLGGLSLLGGF